MYSPAECVTLRKRPSLDSLTDGSRCCLLRLYNDWFADLFSASSRFMWFASKAGAGLKTGEEEGTCAADTSFLARKRLANLRFAGGSGAVFLLATDCVERVMILRGRCD
jgi:hypothetical protein